MADLRNVVLSLPKSELHVHLRGAMPIEVFTDLLNKYSPDVAKSDASDALMAMYEQYDNIRPFLRKRNWSVSEVSNLFRYKDFDQFLTTWRFTECFVRDISDMRALVSGVLQRLKDNNIVYAEITIAVMNYLRQGVTLSDIKTCLDEGSSDQEIRVQWIVDLVRDIGRDAALALLRDMIALGCDGVVGITLGGSEHLFPPGQFSDVYAEARDHGLRLTVHAGEAAGPESIWEAVRTLGVERIGHGVRAVEDPALVAHLRDRETPLEVCPTSNLRTGLYSSYEEHPVRALFDAGVPITINSDDPSFFGTELTDEYVNIHRAGLAAHDLLEIVKNGFRYAFLPAEDIARYIDMVERQVDAHAVA
jgi:adenosine deaminase